MKNMRFLASALVAVLLTALIGCGGSLVSTSSVGGSGNSCSASAGSGQTTTCPSLTAVSGVALSGTVLANAQPVSVAAVQLYAAGNSGNGSAPTALLAAALTSNASGGFSIPAGYSCPSAQTPLYLLSKGGTPAGTAANSSLWLMTALGPCGNLSPGSSVIVDEATTVAAAWALAPFLSTGGKVGATCTNTTGLDNAFITAANLVNPATGLSPGAALASTLTVPTAKLNTLANALAACATSGSSCSTLFAAATSGSSTPTNTADAAFNIARAPGNNLAAIYNLASSSTAYSPALSAAPPDWMLANTLTGNGMNMPTAVSVGPSGDVWLANYSAGVYEFSPAGASLFPSGITGNGINQVFGMAVDIQGNVWIGNEQTASNQGLGDVAELNSSGSMLLNDITGGGIEFPTAVTADSNGNQWIVDYASSKVTLLNSSGVPLSGTSGWGGTSLTFPVALAVDSSHNAWVANQSGELPVTRISADGSTVTNYDCDCNGASGIAVDQNNNLWIANYSSSSVSEVNACGKLELGAITGGGLKYPQGIAVDGAGTVWVSNVHGSSISEIAGASITSPGSFLSPSTGYGTDASMLEPFALAIDASGNIWVSNESANSLTQFIGVATPVKPPLAGPPQLP